METPGKQIQKLRLFSSPSWSRRRHWRQSQVGEEVTVSLVHSDTCVLTWLLMLMLRGALAWVAVTAT